MQEIQEMWVWSLGREDPVEKEMATHSSILAYKIPQTEEPGGLQSLGLQRVEHDWARTTLELTLNCPWFFVLSSWTGLADNESTVPPQIMVLQCCPADLSSIWSLLFTFLRGLWFSQEDANFIKILYLFLNPHLPHQDDFPPSSPKWCTQLEISHRFANHTTINSSISRYFLSFTCNISELCQLSRLLPALHICAFQLACFSQ